MSSKIYFFLTLIRNIIFNRDGRIEKSDILLFGHDANRGTTLSGKAYSPLLDSVRADLELLGYKCQSIAHFGSELVNEKAFGKPVSLNRFYFYVLIMKKIFSRSEPIKKLYGSIISRSGAKIIITIGSPIHLSEAAREAGVFHVELLHGIAYTVLPWGWGGLDRRFLPQGILSLDNVSTRSFSSLSRHGITIKTIPHPFLKRFIPKHAEKLPQEWKRSVTTKDNIRKNILVSLQWGYAGERVNKKGILKNGLFFREIEEMVRSRNDIFWFFRLHPVQLRNARYRLFIGNLKSFVSKLNNCDWKRASYLPFPGIARHCSGNIGMSSMSCYDAAAMGLPSLMLCPTIQEGGILENRFLDLVEEGYVIKALPNLDVINDWVDRVEPKQPRLSNLEDDAAWEDALQWMLKESGLR